MLDGECRPREIDVHVNSLAIRVHSCTNSIGTCGWYSFSFNGRHPFEYNIGIFVGGSRGDLHIFREPEIKLGHLKHMLAHLWTCRCKIKQDKCWLCFSTTSFQDHIVQHGKLSRSQHSIGPTRFLKTLYENCWTMTFFDPVCCLRTFCSLSQAICTVKKSKTGKISNDAFRETDTRHAMFF